MKKLTKILVCFMACFLILPSFLKPNAKADALSQESIVSLNSFTADTNLIFSEFVKFTDRKPGSEDEKKASEYIANYLSSNTALTAKDNTYVKQGVQSFTFESDFSGLYENSQNIIFEYKPTAETKNKVILACNYDSVAYKLNEETYYYELTKTEGVNTSAASVAMLLALAKNLPFAEIDYNIEFVFFGAGESSHAGAEIYVNGISDTDKENILCFVNFDNIALGDNLYYYVNEIETDFSEMVGEISKDNKLKLEQVNVANLNKINLGITTDLGLDYSHIAIESENKVFMKRGITSLNVFAGHYEDGIIIGRNEYSGKEVIAYTENDNVNYITEKVGFENVSKNLYEVFKSMSYILTDSDFVETALDEIDENNWFLAVFGNQKLVVYLSVVAILIFVVVSTYIHYRLSIKAYHANIEAEFLSSVVKISEEIDKTGVDSSVPKVVSQVIAHDIKKDKIIKVKRKKDK